MNKSIWISLMCFSLCVLPLTVFAQAFGEYGRVVGSIPHGQGITGGRAPGSSGQGGASLGGVGEVAGRGLPTHLVVVSKSAALYPRQDEETEKIDQLSQGEALVPMMQAAGGSGWYMVKTSKGLVGWVKGGDVREDNKKNQSKH